MLAVTTAVALRGAAYAVPPWTPESAACARSLDIAPDYLLAGLTAEELVRKLTWLADVVVTGKVVAVEHDLVGAYHTTVAVEVQQALKGTVGSTVKVKLTSGPALVDGRVGAVNLVGESTYDAGETLLLFLSKDHYVSPGGEALFALCDECYRAMSARFVIAGGMIEGRDFTREASWTVAEVKRVAAAQAKNCR